MSTSITLAHLEATVPPRLVQWKPNLRGSEKQRRWLWMPPEMLQWIQQSGAHGNPSKAAITAQFDEFAKGKRLFDDKDVKRVSDIRVPEANQFDAEIWAHGVRITPQWRFFGSFADRDRFVIFSKQRRDTLEKTPALWEKQIDKCVGTWGALFHPDHRLSGPNLSDYLSNAEHYDARW